MTIRKQEYQELKRKADQYDDIVEDDKLTADELTQVEKAAKGPFMTESQFRKRNPDFR